MTFSPNHKAHGSSPDGQINRAIVSCQTVVTCVILISVPAIAYHCLSVPPQTTNHQLRNINNQTRSKAVQASSSSSSSTQTPTATPTLIATASHSHVLSRTKVKSGKPAYGYCRSIQSSSTFPPVRVARYRPGPGRATWFGRMDNETCAGRRGLLPP